MVAEIVCDTFHQRVFGPYDHHCNPFFFHKSGHGLKIVGFDGYVLPHLRRTGIAGSDIERFTLGTLSQFPGQCMFATARA